MKNSKIFLTRNGRSKVRNIEKCKLLRGPKIRVVTSDLDSDDDDWDIDISHLGGRLLDHHVDVLIEDNQVMMPEEDVYQKEHEFLMMLLTIFKKGRIILCKYLLRV